MDPSIPIHDSSFQTPLPLTRENLMNFQDTMEQKDSVPNEILQRYCHEIHQWRQPVYRERCQSSPPQPDIVVASPRVLPFPYHNDSMFLPTAEQIQYRHLHSSTVSSSTSRADLSSIPPESEHFISRPHSTTTTTNIHSNHSLSSFPWERRSLPARLEHTFIISKSNNKPRFLRRSSSFVSNSTLNNTEETTKKPWLKRVLKFFNKSTSRKMQKREEDESIDQVWYCQYSKNPSTRFEKYYQQQQQVISVS
ncbi:hypothetical protein INT47_012755 [Mucor saturninus]|uniref:Uncharacterized protein n=1 Tax=Mucor saturninus TaxID=64648 RepID=A0A8H7QT77_9FUNG|nr:hypothetical protein INT47_012755 [Mucor saturninus]